LEQVTLLRTFIEPKYEHSWGLDEVTFAFSPDGQELAIANGDTVEMWDTASGERRQVFKITTSDYSIYTSIAFSPDGKQLASISSYRTGILWDTATGKSLKTFDLTASAPHEVLFSPDGQQLAILTVTSDVSTLNLKTGIQTPYGGLYGRWGL